jgi:hypothetical protein
MKRWAIILGCVCIAAVIAIIVSLPSLKRKAEAVNCSNQMHAVLFAATYLWPDDHEGKLPLNFLSMSNELGTPKFLVCPSDRSRQAAVSWEFFGTNNCSYEIVSPGLPKNGSNDIFMRCMIHGYVGYGDDKLLDASGKLIKPERFW